MNYLLFHIFAFFFHLLRDVIHFVRFGRTARTFSWPARRPETRPSSQTTPHRDPMAELALLKAENRATMREVYAHRREMNERRRLEREAARARGELPPAKPRKPREPKPQTPPQAFPEVPPAVTAAPPAIPALSIPSRPKPPRTLFKTLSKILTAPLHLLKAALLALPRLFFRRRPPSDGPPAARSAAPSLQNRAA